MQDASEKIARALLHCACFLLLLNFKSLIFESCDNLFQKKKGKGKGGVSSYNIKLSYINNEILVAEQEQEGS